MSSFPPGPVAALLSPRTGVITRLTRTGGVPAPLRLWTARVADCAAFSPWPGDPVGTGCTWGDDDAARLAAVGEAVERYCAALVPPALRPVSAADLATERAGGDAGGTVTGRATGRPIDLGRLALFSPRQYRSPGFPFVAVHEGLPLRWVPGRELGTGRPRAVPIGLVHTTLHRGSGAAAYPDEPRIAPVPYAGLAAGTRRVDAEHNALCELVERDAVTRSWLAGSGWRELSVPPALAGVGHPARVRLFLVPAAIALPVLAALVTDPRTDRLALGTAARADPRRAAAKAVAEAFQLHLMLRALDDPASPLLRLAGPGSGGPLRPWRSDRRYRDSYRSPGWRDVRDLACHLQLYLDPAMRTALRHRLAGLPRCEFGSVAHGTGDIAGALAARGVRPVSVDLTTSEVRAAGWRVVRVVAPGLYPNTPAAFPPLGRSVLDGHQPDPEHAAAAPPLPYA